MWLGIGLGVRLAGKGNRSLFLDVTGQPFNVWNQTFRISPSAAIVVTRTTDVNLIVEVVLSATDGTIVISVPTASDVQLTSSIEFSISAAVNVIQILLAKALVTVSITKNVSEPSIKDITKELSVIDSTDTQVDPRIETEVL